MPSREFPRQAIRKLEHPNFPLLALAAVRDVRAYLDEVEEEAIPKSLELGASADDLAEALGITRQGAYYKINALQKKQAGEGGEQIVDVPELNDDPTA
jgi:transcriptional regulator with PAS, ATPase and Fis domain